MAKRKRDLNTVYISERLRESLRPISRCALTTVVAPMGYGKTTAVNWYLAERAGAEAVKIVRINVYSDNLAIFWRSVQDAFARAGFDMLRDYPCPVDAAGGGLLADDLCHGLAGEAPCYIFIDDFHLLLDQRASAFLCMLANRLPDNVHLIVASRDRFLPDAETVRLGAKVYPLGTEQLRLNHTELSVYAHRCGTELSDAQIDEILYSSEGWFSAVYLNLRTFSEHGVLPSRHSDIYSTFTAAMIDPLPEKRREFLAVMGLADEFTVEMACFVTGDADAKQILSALTEQNAFIKCLEDGVTYRFHHMMKECAERAFATLDGEKQTVYHTRFGEWYEARRRYLHAMTFYRRSGDYDALLRVVQEDAGILLAAIGEHPEMPEEERGDLLGECDLIMSFLCYNDISAMSRLHRSASAQMSRQAISIRNSGGWTFGSPSVLMMFYRAPGKLASELAEMDECMPHYYRITDGHGQGAETIMRAEALFCRGRFTDAHIELERAYAQIRDNGQENMALCCDFLAWRLSLCAEVEPELTLEERRAALLRLHNASWLNIWNATAAYYYALRGETERIPELFAQHRLSAVNILAPGKPMMEMIENQVYLAQGACAKVIGRSEGLLAMCEGMHYALVALHVRIQTAVAYERLGKHTEAQALLRQALSDGEPDGLVMPFVENYDGLAPLLAQEIRSDLIDRIVELGEASRQRKERNVRPRALSTLTEREFEIVRLMAQRLSNREIAERLFLTEGSVKQYVKQIYSKRHIDGDTRTKRRRLNELLEAKA